MRKKILTQSERNLITHSVMIQKQEMHLKSGEFKDPINSGLSTKKRIQCEDSFGSHQMVVHRQQTHSTLKYDRGLHTGGT